MAKQPIDVAAEIVRLESLRTEILREEWRRLNQTPPPKRLSRELLLRGLTYALQEAAFGGLSKSTMRRLETTGGETEITAARRSRQPRRAFKPGTRLVREWQGQTYTVVVLEKGVEWRGRQYRSLSVVAREITGAHWSGPRFFGLKASLRDG